MKKRSLGTLLSAATALTLAFGSVASADIISWTSTDLFAGGDNSDFISQNGTFVAGFNSGTSADTVTVGDSVFTSVTGADLASGFTAGGVTFTGNFSGDAGPTTFGSGEFTAGSPVDSLINSSAFGTPNGDLGVFTLDGLTIGQAYEIQLLLNDARGGGPSGGRDTTFEVGVTDGVGTAVAGIADLNNSVDGQAAGLSGDFLTGTFTADATSQSFNFAATRSGYTLGDPLAQVNSGQSQFNAAQLRAVAVPEPSSMAVLGLGVLGVVLRRRRK